jgi:NAD(P)-dependent dehydrogenase (short-subunit alcohol dehydrogenase family)
VTAAGNGRVVVVTGSTRGIGLGLARELLKRGCRVVVSGRSQGSVDTALAQLADVAGPDRLTGKPAEVSRFEDHEALWQHAVDAFGRVDLWINNAGISLARKPFTEAATGDLDQIVGINLLGVIYGTQVALAGMTAQGAGSIWNMEGFGSDGMTSPGLAPYGSTKRAVTYFTDAVAKEQKGKPVTVSHLSPGIVVTDLLVGDYADDPEGWAKAKKVLNILGDSVETVTPYLADGVLTSTKNGDRVAWLTRGKAARRFATAAFNKRDIFANINQPA